MRLVNGTLMIAASDMSDFLACRHLTRQSFKAAHGEIAKPFAKEAGFDALVARGEEHEAAVLERFRSDLSSDIVELNPFDPTAADNTARAIADGRDIIYQGYLSVGAERGFPDFLVRAELLNSTEPGYEVVDAKLARTAKARAVLQTTFYSRLLANAQGSEPHRMHLALGGRDDLETYRVRDYAAYERKVASMLGEFIGGDEDPYPEPVEHCAICRWRSACIKRRHDEDHLSLVAGITSQQRKGLVAAGIDTLEAFGDLDDPPTLDTVSVTSLADKHMQAKIQLAGRRSGQPEWKLKEPERDPDGVLVPNRGLLGLPEPADGDLFFDIEGARFYSEDGTMFGLQYLFGIIVTSEGHDPIYRAIWSFDRTHEKAGFEELIDFFTEHLREHPGAHIYHYNHYEPTSIDALSTIHGTMQEAVGVLMGRLGTREDALDDLFRMGAFVDLYRVVRQGVWVSVESYSIKRLEPLVGYDRAVPLEEVNERMVVFESALDDGTADAGTEGRETIRGYNEDDCRSTLALRDWLEARRTDLETDLKEPLPRPVAPEVKEEHENEEVAALYRTLREGIPDDPAAQTPEQAGRILMADLLEWHRREDKPAWWRYFSLRGLSDEELLQSDEALAGLEQVEVVAARKKLHDVKMRFPPQLHGLSAGRSAYDAHAEEPFPRANAILSIDEEACELIVTLRMADPPPRALLPDPVVPTPSQRARLRDLAGTICEVSDGPWPRGAATDLLLRRPPNVGKIAGSPLQDEETTAVDAGVALALAMEDTYLPVQGPPGSGKTYLGARIILALVAAGRKVGVTAISHSVIDNLLREVVDVATREGHELPRIGQRVDEDERVHPSAVARGEVYDKTGDALAAIAAGEIDVLGGTTWVWASEHAAACVDTLIVDEAGQMSLAYTLSTTHACRNLILLGDPMQLAQPSQGVHPGGAGASSLEHILDGHGVMPSELGLFISETRRLHPDLCAFTSEVFYDGKLHPMAGLERQAISGSDDLAGSGLRAVLILHEGNTNWSPEEAEAVVVCATELIGRNWTDQAGKEWTIGQDDILVVTPFNDQIAEIEDALETAGMEGIRAGTVDKFQGREAPVTIYSLASSRAETAPRGIEFLYQLNRLNVATSRARCISVLIASRDLGRVFARTPRQMRLANAMCRAEEQAVILVLAGASSVGGALAVSPGHRW